MKILFYVEPHGIRDSFTSHVFPFKTFSSIAREINSSGLPLFSSWEARVFANHFVSTAAFSNNYADWPSVLQPSVAEQRMIEDTARLWMGQGLRDWVTLMTDPGAEITRKYVDILTRIKETEFDFDVLVAWGESMPVRVAAAELGTQVAFFELASMRSPFPRSVLMDPCGVNGAASITQLDVDEMNRAIRPLPSSVLPTFINEEFALGKQNVTIPNARFRGVSEALQEFAGGSHTALVPLQLADDANQILYSPYKSIDDFVDGAVEPLLDAGYKVIIKPHPHARLRGGFVMREQRKVMARMSNRPRILVLPEVDAPGEYLPLLQLVDLVVTNNSSAGFEAMLLGTPASVLGRACYAPLNGLPSLADAIRAQDDEELSGRMKANRALITTYMLACAFPLQRRLGSELVKRLAYWSKPEHENSGRLEGFAEAVGWDTWHQRDYLRIATGISGRESVTR